MPIGISSIADGTLPAVIDYSAQLDMLLLAVAILIGVVLGAVFTRRWL